MQLNTAKISTGTLSTTRRSKLHAVQQWRGEPPCVPRQLHGTAFRPGTAMPPSHTPGPRISPRRLSQSSPLHAAVLKSNEAGVRRPPWTTTTLIGPVLGHHLLGCKRAATGTRTSCGRNRAIVFDSASGWAPWRGECGGGR
jgi:hypothetical protein